MSASPPLPPFPLPTPHCPAAHCRHLVRPVRDRPLLSATLLPPFPRFTCRDFMRHDATRRACPKNFASFDPDCFLPLPPFLPFSDTSAASAPPYPPAIFSSASSFPVFSSARVERSFTFSSSFCRFTLRCVLGVYVSPKILTLLTWPQSSSFSLLLTSSFSLLGIICL